MQHNLFTFLASFFSEGKKYFSINSTSIPTQQKVFSAPVQNYLHMHPLLFMNTAACSPGHHHLSPGLCNSLLPDKAAYNLAQGSKNISCKGPWSKYFSFAGHTISVTYTQFCPLQKKNGT